MEENIEMKALLPPIVNISNMSDVEIAQWADARKYTLLMVAAEEGRLETVNLLIQRGMNVNQEVKYKTAVGLAYTKKHFSVVLALLKANSKFPRSYNNEKASDELRAFVALSTNLHDKIRTNNQENLKEILTENPSLRHHYDTNNNSALKIAIITAMFSMVEFLLNNNIILGPHEDIKNLVRRLSEDQVTKLSELHLKLSKHIFSNILMTFMRNCRFGPDDDGTKNLVYMSLVSKAFNFLLEIPSVAIILKIVAATREFTLVFDFNREWTNYADPLSEPYTNGIFYVTGQIFIGAKNLLDPLKAIETYSVIAHELCHFAMFLVFKNNAKPYRENDKLGEENFQVISNECKAQMEGEKLVKSVYEDYELDMHHAELIVRAPQMIVLYHNQPELQERRALFPNLIDHFERVSVPALENALPSIEKKYRPKIEKKVKNQRNLIILLGIFLLFLIPCAYLLYNPIITYEELSTEDKMTFNNVNVNFQRLDLKFRDLFANDSEVYGLLSSEQIKKALKGDTTDLFKTVYWPFIYLTWTNMTDNLKNMTFYSNANFQGQKVPLNSILISDSALKLLNSNDIRDLLKNQALNISKPVELKTKFFVNRFFIDEDLKFDAEQLDKIEQRKSFDDVTEFVSKERVFLLSNSAGEGKSTTLRHFAFKLKQQFPLKWIQYVDLKNYLKALNERNLDTFDEILQFLGSDILKLEKFELKVFEDRFKSNEMIILWDGIDEIAPAYKELMLELTSKVQKLTENFQFVSTRPQYSLDFEFNFRTKAYKLIPLDTSERLELLIKFLATKVFSLDVNDFNSQNMSDNYELEIRNFNLNSSATLKFLNLFEKGRKVFVSIESSDNKDRLVTNPLLIGMISDIILEENFTPTSDLNIYQVFDIFITKKFEIVFEKGSEVIASHIKTIKRSSVNIMQIHQALALKNVFSNHIKIYLGKQNWDISNFDIMSSLKDIEKEEILRYGIIQVTSDEEFVFTHQTFAEYLVAQFFINNMKEFDFSKDDTHIRLFAFNAVLFTDKFDVVQSFLINYEKTSTNLVKIFEIHHTLSTNLLNITKNQEIFKYFLYLNFHKFFQQQFNIEYATYFSNDFLLIYVWDFNDFKEFITKCDDFKRVFSHEDFKVALLGENTIGETMLQKVSLSFDDFLEPFINKIIEAFTFAEINSFMRSGDYLKQTFLNLAFRGNQRNIEIFWNFTIKVFAKNEQEKLLMAENKASLTALHSVTWNTDSNSFLFIKKIYETFFSQTKMQNIFLRINERHVSFVFVLVQEASLETAKEVAKYFAELFKSEKFKLRKILSYRVKNGHTVFSLFKGRSVVKEKLNLFVELLRETFLKNEMQKCKDFELHLENPLRFLEINFSLIEDFQIIIDKLRASEWFNEDFKFFLTNFKALKSEIGLEKLKTLILSKNVKNNGNLLHELLENAYETQVLSFLNLLSSLLSNTEITSLILAQDTLKNSPLMYAVKYQNLKNLEIYWKFIEQHLSIKDQEKLLHMENQAFLTALQNSAVSESFNFIAEIYSKKITSEKIQKIILNYDNQDLPFVGEIMQYGSPELCQKVANFLQKLFEGEKLQLQKFLSHRNAQGHTIFTFLSLEQNKFKNQIKVFEKLAKNIFESEKLLENLKVPSRFLNFPSLVSYRDIEVLRLEPWSSSDFQYFTENFDKFHGNLSYRNMKNLLLSQNYENKSLLHEFILNADDEIFEPFILKIENFLTNSEIYIFFSMLDVNLQSPLMLAAKLKSMKFLQSYFNALNRTLSKNELKSLLEIKDKSLWSVLHFSASNKNENSFNFVLKTYQNFFSEPEIRNIILPVRKDELPFVYVAIEESSIKNCHEVAEFLKILFKNDKYDLRELLSHINNEGNSIYNQADNKQNLQIFIQLLGETFEKNETEKFTKALNFLKLQSFLLKSSDIESGNYLMNFMKIILSHKEHENILNNEETIKTFLLRKTAKNETILHKLFEDTKRVTDKIMHQCLGFLRLALSSTDIKNSLFIQESEFNATSLMLAAKKANEKDLRLIWNFISDYLSENEQKHLLMIEDDSSLTALIYATWNKDANSFLFMIKIYEHFFTRNGIQEYFLQPNYYFLSFLFTETDEAILKTTKEVANYIVKLFKNENPKIMQMIRFRNRDAEKTTSLLKNEEGFKEKYNIYIGVLGETLERNYEAIEDFFKDLSPNATDAFVMV